MATASKQHGLQLGRAAAIPVWPDKAMLDRVPNPHADTHFVARFTFPEFTSICPVTGQPDFGILMIDYVPEKRWSIVEVAETLSQCVPQSRRVP